MHFLLLPACDLRSLTGKLPNYEVRRRQGARAGAVVLGAVLADRRHDELDGVGVRGVHAEQPTNPTFSVAAHDTRVWLDGVDASFVGLQVSGTFSADGTRIGEGRLTGTLDLRPADAQGDPGAWCDALGVGTHPREGAACQGAAAPMAFRWR